MFACNNLYIKKRNGRILPFSYKDYSKQYSYLHKAVEPYKFKLKRGGNWIIQMLHKDKAIYGLGHICQVAFSENRKVYLSGQGADEIMSDYSKFPAQSELHGKYPEKLSPWTNFYSSYMESYIMKEEYIAGAYGIETRYPFLDKEVVQEFLWLKPELKNRMYKAPLDYYLTQNDYPFLRNTKHGFNPLRNA